MDGLSQGVTKFGEANISISIILAGIIVIYLIMLYKLMKGGFN